MEGREREGGCVVIRGGRVCSDQGRVVQWPGEGMQ